MQLLWEFRGEQHTGVEPQRPDEPIDNQPDPLPDRPFDSPIGNAPEDAVPDRLASTDRELIVQPTGIDLRRLRPQIVLHVHVSHEATGPPEPVAGRPGSKAWDP